MTLHQHAHEHEHEYESKLKANIIEVNTKKRKIDDDNNVNDNDKNENKENKKEMKKKNNILRICMAIQELLEANFADVIEMCEPYTQDSNYVYKLLKKEYLAIMKKHHDTQTNENRINIIDENNAVYKADKLEICLLIDVNTLETCNEVNNNYICYNPYKLECINYIVGKTISCTKSFNPTIYNNCNNDSSGIHYHKNLIRALHGAQYQDIYPAYDFAWNCDGQSMFKKTKPDMYANC
jgi:hypothetical protein